MADRHATTVHLCNASGVGMLVWLEPWAQEFQLESRGELLLECWSDGACDPTPELEMSHDMITVYGASDTRLAVFINGVDQNSFSAECTAPDAGPLTTRGFVESVFKDFPEARPGGRPTKSSKPLSVLGRLVRQFFGG